MYKKWLGIPSITADTFASAKHTIIHSY
jgi:hypothetical protein